MSNKAITFFVGAILVVSSAALASAQTTATTVTQTPTTANKTVQHPDGTYTVIEYPLKKEVKVLLNPGTLAKSKGVATILRDDDGTRVVLNLTDVPADVETVNLYAVDHTGAVTLLGPVTIANGGGTLTATTPLSKFMLIASPEAALTAYDPKAKVFFRSAVPEGFAVIPHTTAPVGENVTATGAAVSTPATTPAAVTTTAPVAITAPVTTTAPVTITAPVTTTAPVTITAPVTTTAPVTITAPVTTTAPVGETVAATGATVSTPATTYSVPMLNIPVYEKGDDTKIKVNFSGALAGTRANVFVTPNKGGATKVKMVFHELKDAPTGKVFTVWAISPDNAFVKLGQIVNMGKKNEAEIQSEVAFPDFGLLVTMEDATATTIVSPVGPAIGIVEIVR